MPWVEIQHDFSPKAWFTLHTLNTNSGWDKKKKKRCVSSTVLKGNWGMRVGGGRPHGLPQGPLLLMRFLLVLNRSWHPELSTSSPSVTVAGGSPGLGKAGRELTERQTKTQEISPAVLYLWSSFPLGNNYILFHLVHMWIECQSTSSCLLGPYYSIYLSPVLCKCLLSEWMNEWMSNWTMNEWILNFMCLSGLR